MSRDAHVRSEGQDRRTPGGADLLSRKVGLRLNDFRHAGTIAPVMSARTLTPRKPPLATWLAYHVRGAKAALLGHITASDLDSAIAAAAEEYRLPANRIIVQRFSNA
jgi:hypothetical protein